MSNKISYSELIRIQSYEDRLKYVMLNAKVGDETFGSHRYLNQNFYKSKEWKDLRNKIIYRDNGCDLGISDRPIGGKIIVHHLNPIEIDNFQDALNPDNLICVSHETHNLIHYGYAHDIPNIYQERKPNDTCPWK